MTILYNGNPDGLLTYTSPSAKLCLGPSGTYRYGPHNLYVNSASPANQSITVVSGAAYTVVITGSVSVTASGAATGTWTAGTTSFTAATGTLTLGSTSGTGTVHVRRTNSDTTYLATGVSARYGLPYEWDSSGVLQGILAEEARTNVFLNNRAPATQTCTVTNAASYTVSFFGTGSITFSGANSSTLNGTGASNRVITTFTTTSTSLTCTVSGTIDLVQVEAGAFATSPIETFGATVTRAVDNISLSASAFPNGAAMTMFVEGSFKPTTSIRSSYLQLRGSVLSTSYGSSFNIAQLSTAYPTAGKRATAYVYDTTPTQVASLPSSADLVAGRVRLALAFAPNDYAFAHNGYPEITSAASSYMPAWLSLQIGSISTGANALNGYIRKLYVLPRKQTAVEMKVKTNFLTVYSEGDSITAAGGAGYPDLYLAGQTAFQVNANNNAVSGSVIADLVTRSSTLDSKIITGRRNVLTVMAGRNDVVVVGNSAATVLSDLAAYCDARRAAGWYVIVATLLPGVTAGFNTTRNSINATIRTWAGVHADAVWDAGADSTMGPDAAAADINLYSDGTHPTPLGQAYLTTSVAAILDTLIL